MTLLLTDVVDSTELNARYGDAVMGPLWAAHDRRSRELMRAWRAREIARSDGFLLLFEDAWHAVGFAAAYHRCLAALTIPLRARVGIHTGPVSLRENAVQDVARGAPALEVDGLALPATARLGGLASGRQTLVSTEVTRSLAGAVQGDRVLLARAAAASDPESTLPVADGAGRDAAELRLLAHGHWRFKGIEAPMEVVQIGADGDDFAPPPDSDKGYRVVFDGTDWTPARELPRKLPAERDRFVGRDADLQALAQRLRSGERLVSLLGIGGIGKTRLVVRFAHRWLGDYAGGAWFCDLSAAQGPEGITYAMAQALEVPLGKSEPVEQIGAVIAERGACLVVLDNFEQVARHAEATLGVWLARAPLAQFIVTSREVLGIVGEHAMLLSPLVQPEAERLLRERLSAAGLRSPLSPADEAALAPLVELLDRLPLAIELAAARARVMPPSMLLSRMGERFKLLASRSGRQDRQATLRATLDWSWELLSSAERSALAQCSVFEGGFTLGAAEAVIDLSAVADAAWTADVLQGLDEKSLLKRSPTHRFDLLRSVHDYAAEHLGADGRFPGSGEAGRRNALERHWRYYASLDERAAIAERCIEAENLVAACRRATADCDLDRAADALVAAWAALNLTGPFSVAIRMADELHAVAHPHAMAAAMTARWVSGHARYLAGAVSAARRDLEDALWPGADARQQSRVLCALGQLERSVGRFDRADELLARGLARASEAGDLGLTCRAFNAIGTLRLWQGRLDDAIDAFATGLEAARAADDLKQQAALLGNIGVVERRRGNDEAAHRHYEEALLLAQQIGDRRFEGNMRSNIGFGHYRRGDFERAFTELHEARKIAQGAGLTRLSAEVSCNLGLVELELGHRDAVSARFDEAIRLTRLLQDEPLEGHYRIYFGRSLARLGRLDEARACLDDSARQLVGSTDLTLLGLLACANAEVEALREAGESALDWLARAKVHLDAGSRSALPELSQQYDRVCELISFR